jgi:hypothetical protein
MSETGIEETWRADAAEQRVCELHHENAVLRGAMARLCRAVSRRMMPDEPTPEDRMELREAFDAASSILHNDANRQP